LEIFNNKLSLCSAVVGKRILRNAVLAPLGHAVCGQRNVATIASREEPPPHTARFLGKSFQWGDL
jgi:hypothetical protein